MLGLVLGGALTVISWRLAFLINVPIGILIIVIALTRLEETRHERLKLDVTGALLATLACTAGGAGVHPGPAARLGRPVGDRRRRRGGGLASWSFLVVERTADNPLVPFSVFDDRNRVMTFTSLFLGRRRAADR